MGEDKGTGQADATGHRDITRAEKPGQGTRMGERDLEEDRNEDRAKDSGGRDKDRGQDKTLTG